MPAESTSIEQLYNIITFSDVFRRYSGSNAMAVYRDYFIERISAEKAKNICELDGYVDSYTLKSDASGVIIEDPPVNIGNVLCELFIESALSNKGALTASNLIDTVKKHVVEQESERHYISSYYSELLGNLPSPYRTKLRASDTMEIPAELYLPIGEKYEYALTFYHNKNTLAHMEIAEMTENLEFKDGVLMIKGMPASRVELINYQTKEGIEDINLMYLRAFFSIMLTDAENQLSNGLEIRDTAKVYAPALLRYIGKENSYNESDFRGLVKSINNYQNVYGSLKSEDGKSETFYQVLNVSSYNPDENTLEVSSPYMSNIINNIYDDRVLSGKLPKEVVDRFDINEIFETTSLIKHEIIKERSKLAVEIVVLIVRKIAQAESGKVVKVKVREIFNKIPELKYQIFDKKAASGQVKSTKDKNKAIKRIFSKAWELLKTKTYIEQVYPGMVLPQKDDPAALPTINDMDKEFLFDTAVETGDGSV